MMIKAIIFDVDGVLLDSYEANITFYQDIFQKVGYIKPDREELSKVFHLSMYAVIEKLIG